MMRRKIPSLKGLKVADAKKLLKSKRFKYHEETEKKFSLTVPTGEVIKAKAEDNTVRIIESNRKLVLIPAILVVFAAGLLTTFGNKIYQSIQDQIMEVTGKIDAPEISYDKDWKQSHIIKITKDPKGKIDYYEYCIVDENKKCEWKETHTKNVLVGETGEKTVRIRAVTKNGKRGKEVKVTVLVDNQNPVIDKLEIIEVTDNSIKVKTKADDQHSGIVKYLYSLDGQNYVDGDATHLFKNLKADTEYDIYVKVVDKAGNEIIIKDRVKTGKLPEVIWDIPKISLDKLPSVIMYGDDYKLPTEIDFGNDTGEVKCIVNKTKEVTNASEIGPGTNKLVCTATSSHGKTATVEKIVRVELPVGQDEVWDGWIKLNLYYPEGSYNWQWRLDGVNGIRTGYNGDDWQDYTGPILIRIEDVENVYIRYDMDGETYVVAPRNKLAVDIQPEHWSVKEGQTTKVTIYYDKDSEERMYRVNGGSWQDYEGEFEVGPNSYIEAKATRIEGVYDSTGEYLYDKTITGTDLAYVSLYMRIDQPVPPGIPGPPINPYIGQNYDNPGVTPSSGPGYNHDFGPSNPLDNYESDMRLAGPIITSDPSTEITETTRITITPQYEAYKVYYKIGNGAYKEYTGPFDVDYNCIIYAYYVRKSDGMTSQTSKYRVKNIYEGQLPYIVIDADPDYLSKKVNSTLVTITGSNYDTLEYSLDGKIYQDYIGSFIVTQSCTVYAKATNSYGTKIETLTITTNNPAKAPDMLTVFIEANPKDEGQVVGSTEVTITYDTRATKRYYSLDGWKTTNVYTGPFTVTKNTTVEAYATSENGYGSDILMIDYLTEGAATPIITADPAEQVVNQSVEISIEYDRNAIQKLYKIDNGDWLDYEGPFTLDKSATITAYNENAIGQNAQAVKKIDITNIGQMYTILDLGDYYLIRLNYPPTAMTETREYRWKTNGVWKAYDDHGFLLIKPGLAEKYKLNTAGVEVEDTKGNKVRIDMTHVYVLDVPLSEMTENIYMRWETENPKAPTIMLEPELPTKEATVIINYSQSLVEKQYRVITPSGTDTGWIDYEKPFKVTESNTLIYAKGRNISKVESEVGIKRITNIDEIKPTIGIKGDLTTPKKKVNLAITATDEQMMYMVKYAKGTYDVDYFNENKGDNGISILNGSTIGLTENGIYTIYAVDQAGNETIRRISVTNVDNNAPDISIDVLSNGKQTQAEVSISYGNSVTKQYKVGVNGVYQDYPEATEENPNPTLKLSAYDYHNLKNSDGSITLYARGVDEAGNETIVQEKLYCLDLDMPQTPVIRTYMDYPLLTETGVKMHGHYNVTFDSRNDVINEISVDGGETWTKYNGPDELTESTIKARTRKIDSGLTSSAEKAVSLPSGSLPLSTYDGNTASGITTTGTFYMDVDEDAWEITIKNTLKTPSESSLGTSSVTFEALNAKGDVLLRAKSASQIVVPKGTTKFRVSMARGKGWGGSSAAPTLYEIQVSTRPNIFDKGIYPQLTEDGFIPVKHEVTIKYLSYLRNKEYSLDNGETWKKYSKPFEASVGTKVLARAKNKDGSYTETNTLTVTNASDIIDAKTYDEDLTTVYQQPANTTKTFMVDQNVAGKAINIYLNGTVAANSVVKLYDAAKNEIEETSVSMSSPVTVVKTTTDTVYVSMSSGSSALQMKEIELRGERSEVSSIHPVITSNSPDFEETKTITIAYPEGYTNEYSIDSGETWQEYTGSFVIEEPTTIFARTIDENDKVTSTSSYYAYKVGYIVTDSILDAIKTDHLKAGYYKFKVDEIVYPVHVYVYNGDQVWDTDKTFGDDNDVSTKSGEYAKNMVVVKVNGNLTIGEGVTVGPYYTTYGGPKGFTLYVTGTLTNNGTIDNSHGAYAKGQDVYLYKNSDGTYETIPATGATGGTAVGSSCSNCRYNGRQGADGYTVSARSTGGGGSGGAQRGDECGWVSSGAGGAGTSYSGGSGGGSINMNCKCCANNAGAGSSEGGPGGNAATYRTKSTWVARYAGGGAGNGSGLGSYCNSVSHDGDGESGTGGLLVIYANNVNNASTGTISANGHNGGIYDMAGGSSGGGSINIFYNGNYANDGTMTVKGGSTNDSGGSGGDGTISVGKINNNKYETTLYTYNGSYQTFTAPRTGYYKVELWGAQGGDMRTGYTGKGGRGGYTSGEIMLSEGEQLYLYVGSKGEGYTNGYSTFAGGYNGGGTTSGGASGGGGATDIRLTSGTWNSFAGLASRIMVAGAGGGSNDSQNGGYGGGLTAGIGVSGSVSNGGPGTQISAGTGSNGGSFGIGGGSGSSDGGSGGGGYYGGGKASGASVAGGGGSSFISGHAGSIAISENSVADNITVKDGCDTITSENELICSVHSSWRYFLNTKMIDGSGYSWTDVKGEQEQMPNPLGGYYALGEGHIGNGYALITYVGDENSISSDPLKDIVAAATASAVASSVDVPTITVSTNVDSTKTVTISYTPGYTNQYSIDLGQTWQEYTDPFILNENATVIARSLEGNNVVSSSTFTITSIIANLNNNSNNNPETPTGGNNGEGEGND